MCGDRVCYIEVRIRRRSERIAWWPGEVRDKGSRIAKSSFSRESTYVAVLPKGSIRSALPLIQLPDIPLPRCRRTRRPRRRSRRHLDRQRILLDSGGDFDFLQPDPLSRRQPLLPIFSLLLLPIQRHLERQHSVQSRSKDESPPKHLIPRLRRRREDPREASRERVEDEESGELARRA